MSSSFPNPRRDGESGFMLLAAICLMVLLLISLAIAAPKMARAIQRDKEMEAIQRGEQYRLAIKKYYKQFGAYPTSVKQLLNTNNMRFLRQEYADPLTGKDDWKPILYGQAHVRPLGFFGKPLSAIGGIAASGVMGGGMTAGMYAIEPTSTDANGNPVSSGSDNTAGTTGNDTGGAMGGGFGSSNSSMGGDLFSSGQNGSSFGTPIGGPSPTPGFGSTTSPGSTAGSGFGGTSATTFGANGIGPIVGFTLPINKGSLIDYMEQDHYNKWEFNYDPAADQLQQAVSLLGGGGTAMNNSSPATTANPYGGSNPGTNGPSSIFGGSNPATGTSGSTGTTSGSNPSGSTNTPQSPDSNPQ